MREELLTCAQDLIRSRGYSGYSYADVSERVGIRKATIHHYFPTKRNLTATALQAYRTRYKSALLRAEEEFDMHSIGLTRMVVYTSPASKKSSDAYVRRFRRNFKTFPVTLKAEQSISSESIWTGLNGFMREAVKKERSMRT